MIPIVIILLGTIAGSWLTHSYGHLREAVNTEIAIRALAGCVEQPRPQSGGEACVTILQVEDNKEEKTR